MRKKYEKKILLGFLMVFLSVMCVGFGKKICVYANECDVDYEISSNDGNIWIEEGETYWAQCDVGIDQIDSGSEIGINNSSLSSKMCKFLFFG